MIRSTGGYAFAVVKMLLDHPDIDGLRIDLPAFNPAQDIPGSKDDLVPASVGEGDVEVKLLVVLCSVLRGFDCGEEVVRATEPGGSTRPGSSTRPGRSWPSARTSAATTRWTS